MRCRLLKALALLGVGVMLAAGLWAKDKREGAEPAANPRIAREVRHELIMPPCYGVFDNLAYRVEGDTVTLLGQVTRPTLKSDAEGVVKQIEDDRIRIAEYRAIYGQTALNLYALRAVPRFTLSSGMET
jgi:hypothetical protein